MNRQIVWSGAIPLETDLLNTNKYTMIALAKLASALMGSSTYIRGLACTASSPASMVVNVGAGEIYSLANVDATAYSSLTADTTHSILKQGYVLDAQTFTLTAPTTSGYSVNYLIQATYSDTDGGSTVLPYYNATNPSTAWSGPNNSGSSQYTVRQGLCTVSLKAGVAATTGTQTTPAVDTGYTGLYVITVAYGASTVTASNISIYANAPFIPSAGIVDAVQRNAMGFGTDTGAANAYVVNLTPGMLSLSAGTEITFLAANANTGSSTLNVCGFGASSLLNKFGSTLIAGEIAVNSLATVEWNGSAWQLLEVTSAIPTVPTASSQTNSTQIASTAFVHAASAGVIGDSRNLSMSIPTAAATATLTADEVVVGTALGGSMWRLGSISKAINLATTGAGGMDTGSITTGYVAIYLIYNPTTNVSALLGYNATSALASEVYPGANMPTGYTASALVSVWRVASSQFVVGNQFGRKISFPQSAVLTTTTQQTTLASFPLSSLIPPNARMCSGNGNVNPTSSSTNNYFSVSGSSAGIGSRSFGTSNSGLLVAFDDVTLITSQTAYYTLGTSGTLTTSYIYLTDYVF